MSADKFIPALPAGTATIPASILPPGYAGPPDANEVPIDAIDGVTGANVQAALESVATLIAALDGRVGALENPEEEEPGDGGPEEGGSED